MAELKGVTGKIARVDLTTKKVTVIEPPVEVYKKFLGGEALGLYFMVSEGIIDPKVEPFSPQNMVQFLIGPVTGIGPNARSTIVTKSAYNFMTVTTSGGRAAAELKFAGWDGIQVVGKSDKPVYIAVVDDNIEIRDASHIWGKGTEEAELELLKSVLAPIEWRESILTDRDLTPEWAALRPVKRKGIGAKRLAAAWVIGPGGENGVWYANVITEGARAHGRYGAGAIMGSKNLKGIVIRGTKGHMLADKAKFLQLVREIQASEATNYFWRSFGTAGIGARVNNSEDAFPIRNWQWGAWADPMVVKALEGPWMDAASFVKQMACPGCTLHCMYLTEITSKDPLMDGVITDMPDWEAMGMVGGNLGYCELEGKTPSDPWTGDHWDLMEALAKTQYTTAIHDNNGICYIEGGALLAMLMELRQRNLITPADLDGIDLKWGDVHAVDAMVKKIVHKEGIGAVLAKGTWETAKYFAEKKGKPEIMDYAMTGHRYAQPAHDVRGFDKDALEYVTVERPCEHTGGGGAGFLKKDYPAAIAGQNTQATHNSLVICSFAAGNWAGKIAAMVQAATGWTDFTEDDVPKVGARAYALARIFNLTTQGIKDPKKEWDNLFPPRWFKDPLPTGIGKGRVAYEGKPEVLYNEALPAYWKARGWSEDKGVPLADTLKALGIDDIAEPYAAKLR
ncbi:MAG: aldehyde ferredoxin oxidoreductase family protein [Anaerolineae bacterium]